jgi:hypothetical protein
MVAAFTLQVEGLVAQEMLLTLCKENNILTSKGMKSFFVYRPMGFAT